MQVHLSKRLRRPLWDFCLIYYMKRGNALEIHLPFHWLCSIIMCPWIFFCWSLFHNICYGDNCLAKDRTDLQGISKTGGGGSNVKQSV
ncbi:hypothetical protein DET56_10920 [Paenibacillus pabuli]|uniref:Uncharacterized protein n=1 Tax=Paenibacillus pabuli TaxID=1472 RepID=A0A855XQL2_9BACL|nr:hypothetical protein DET56_10920 [Paenibacillus pabuli]PXW05279.1 hypothetical protein DEU73_10820 [Paenibacillus taichungensis]